MATLDGQATVYSVSKVDRTALRFNQACIVALLALAFVMNWAWLAGVVGLIMLAGTIWPQAGLFKLFYARVLKPRGWLKPEIVADEQAPHLFAQGLGGLFLAGAALAFALGAGAAGWALALMVAALALVNLSLNFCLGCFIYYQLARRGVRVALPLWGPAAHPEGHR